MKFREVDKLNIDVKEAIKRCVSTRSFKIEDMTMAIPENMHYVISYIAK